MSSIDLRLMAGLLLVVAGGTVNLLWVLLYSSVRKAAHGQGVTVAEGLQLDTPEFQEGFSSSLQRLSDVQMLLNISGGARFWILIIASCAVCLLWFKTDLRAEPLSGRFLFGSLVLVPSIVGLGMVPGLIRESFEALAEAGLSQPEFIAAGATEAFAPFVVGGVLSLLLLLGFVLLLRRPTKA